MPTLETFKCPSCGHVYFWNGHGSRPENCTQKRKGLDKVRTCGYRLVKQGEIKDVKNAPRNY